ncbi:hypothetical protein [Vibrio phage vB_VpaP_SJSY21]|nr:hypothetical protein [Vibrio phage vB_VpaP_SJSY21]
MVLKSCKVCGSELHLTTTTPFGKQVSVSKHKCTDSACRNPEVAKCLLQVWKTYSSRSTHIKPFKGGNVFRYENYQFNIHDNGKIVIIDLTDNKTVIVKEGRNAAA